MDRLSEQALTWISWIWTVLWVLSFVLGAWLLGPVAAAGLLVLGVSGTFAIDHRRRRVEEVALRARIAEEVRGRTRADPAGPLWTSTGPSIHDHILRHLPSAGQPLDDAGLRLPDEAPPDGERLRWAPGAWDGILVSQGFSDADPGVVDRIHALLAPHWSPGPGAPPTQALEDAVMAAGALRIVDPLMERLREQVGTPDGPSAMALRDLGHALATRSARRESVKLGMSILGLGMLETDIGVLMTLGRHDEFTLYTAVALRTIADHEPLLFDLAREVRGWGRIHLVWRLASATDAVITDWIVRDGFRNEVMDEYLAPVAAKAGRLADRLATDPDEPLVDSACDIVVALINGGPVQGMPDYPDGSRAVDLLLSLLTVRPLVPARLVATDVIERFLADEGGPWTAQAGWGVSERAELRSRCLAVKARPGWRERIEEDLGSTDAAIAATARQAARLLGMDTFAAVLERVRAEPLGFEWHELLEQTDEGRIGTVIELAVAVLPLDTIGSGPGRELGLGPGWEAHRALDTILQALRRFPGQGWVLIRAGLASPVIRNRNLALLALHAWGPAAWPPDARTVVERSVATEPDHRIRAAMLRMLAGGPFEEPKDEDAGPRAREGP